MSKYLFHYWPSFLSVYHRRARPLAVTPSCVECLIFTTDTGVWFLFSCLCKVLISELYCFKKVSRYMFTPPHPALPKEGLEDRYYFFFKNLIKFTGKQRHLALVLSFREGCSITNLIFKST
jgi:hypothetical protein